MATPVLRGLPTPTDQWRRSLEIARLAEDLGFDSLWVWDHLHTVPEPGPDTLFECWTLLTAASQQTSRIGLGQMAGCAPFRHPGLVAKMAATLDVASGGRLELGIGAGWYRSEFDAYGIPLEPPARRIGYLAETVRAVRALWSGEPVTMTGDAVRLDAAWSSPRPLQDSPPILVAGGGERRTLRVVAELADRANWGGNLDEWSAKAATLDRHCQEIGRDPSEVTKTVTAEVLIRPTDTAIERLGSLSVSDEPAGSWRRGNFVGTPDQVAEKIERYRARGCDGFILWCADYPSVETLELLGTQVLPRFRTAAPAAPQGPRVTS